VERTREKQGGDNHRSGNGSGGGGQVRGKMTKNDATETNNHHQSHVKGRGGIAPADSTAKHRNKKKKEKETLTEKGENSQKKKNTREEECKKALGFLKKSGKMWE